MYIKNEYCNKTYILTKPFITLLSTIRKACREVISKWELTQQLS